VVKVVDGSPTKSKAENCSPATLMQCRSLTRAALGEFYPPPPPGFSQKLENDER